MRNTHAYMIGLLAGLLLSGTGAAAEEPKGRFYAGDTVGALEGFARELSASPNDPEALYFIGRLTAEAGAARRYFSRVVAEHPEHDLADDALFELGETDYAGPMGLYMSARKHYADLIRRYPKSPLVPLALYRIGRTYLAANAADSAGLFFSKVIQEFPASEVRERAEVGLVEADEKAGRRLLARARAESLAAQGLEGPDVDGIFRRVGASRDTSASHPAMPRAAVDGRYWVQVGAFASSSNMAELARTLDGLGYRLRSQSRRGKTLHILQVGPYADRETAERVREHIDLVEGTQSQVVEEGRPR